MNSFRILLVSAGLTLTALIALLVGVSGQSPASLSSLAQVEPAAAQPSIAPQQVQAGETIDAAIPLNDGQRTQLVGVPGAAFIRVHFGQFNLAPGDSVTVSAPDGSQAKVYSAGHLGWAHSVFAESALVTLNSSGGSSVLIDRFLRGYSEAELRSRSLCGSSNFLDAICVNSGLFPNELDEARSVARLIFDVYEDLDGNPATPLTYAGYAAFCTGWRVSPSNVVATNEHCFNSAAPSAQLQSVEVQFNFQRAVCGIAGNTIPTVVGANGVLFSDSDLDVTVFTVDNFNAIAQFGYIDIEYTAPLVGEQIFIPQHPNGDPKQLVLNSDLDAGRCYIHQVDAEGVEVGSETDIAYTCDTLGGSSGSPVISAITMHAVGLHHYGAGGVCSASGSMNQGVRWDRILTPYAYLFLDQIQYNGGFEDGMRDWKGVLLTDDGVTGTGVRTGTKAFKFNGGDGERSKIVQTYRPANLGLIAGDSLVASAYINSTGATNVRLILKIFYAGQPVSADIEWLMTPTAGYQQFTVQREIQPGEIRRVKLIIKHNNPSGVTLIDDVRIDWQLAPLRDRGGIPAVQPLALPLP